MLILYLEKIFTILFSKGYYNSFFNIMIPLIICKSSSTQTILFLKKNKYQCVKEFVKSCALKISYYRNSVFLLGNVIE